jgi:hypothetical protein
VKIREIRGFDPKTPFPAKNMHDFAQKCTNLHTFARICTILHNFAQLCTHLHKSAQKIPSKLAEPLHL